MLRIQEYHLHLPHYHFDDTRNMRLLYAIRVVRDLVNKSALFFLPIFLYSLGKDLWVFEQTNLSDFQKGMVTLAVYLCSQGLVGMLTSIPSAQLTSRIGHQRSIVISHALRLVAFAAFFFARQYPSLLLVAMVFEGLQTPFFWNSYHTILSQSALKRHMGQDLGLLQFLLQLAAVVAPALGGMLGLLFGIEVLFLVGLVGTLIAVSLALSMDIETTPDSVQYKEFRRWLQERRYRELVVTFAGRYYNDAALFVWPLYVFLLINGIDRVGYLYTLSLFLAMVLSFFIGTYIDRHHTDAKPYVVTGGFLSVLWLLRSQLFSVWNIALADMVEKIAGNFHWLFYDSVVLRRGKGSQALSYFAYREWVIDAVGAVFWLFFALFFYFVDGGWNVLFLVAAVGVLMSSKIRDKEPLNEPT